MSELYIEILEALHELEKAMQESVLHNNLIYMRHE
jgi:hypothetical protein